MQRLQIRLCKAESRSNKSKEQIRLEQGADQIEQRNQIEQRHQIEQRAVQIWAENRSDRPEGRSDIAERRSDRA